MSKTIKNLKNKKFGLLTPVEFLRTVTPSNRKVIYWVCKCDCGKTHKVLSSNLQNGNTTSCGCNNGKLAIGQSALNALYTIYKHSAKRRNLEFNLSKDIFTAFTKTNCFYCGSSPKSEYFHPNGRGNGSYIYNGLDRLDNNQGYLKSNCVACCPDCNKAKLTRTVKEYEKWILTSADYIKTRTNKDITSIV